MTVTVASPSRLTPTRIGPVSKQQEEGSSSQSPPWLAGEASCHDSNSSASTFSMVSRSSSWHRSSLDGSWELAAPSLVLCKTATEEAVFSLAKCAMWFSELFLGA